MALFDHLRNRIRRRDASAERAAVAAEQLAQQRKVVEDRARTIVALVRDVRYASYTQALQEVQTYVQAQLNTLTPRGSDGATLYALGRLHGQLDLLDALLGLPETLAQQLAAWSTPSPLDAGRRTASPQAPDAS